MIALKHYRQIILDYNILMPNYNLMKYFYDSLLLLSYCLQ